MSFSSILRSIVDGCGGGLGAALMGNDGIAIDQVTASVPSHTVGGDDVSAAGIEFGRILEEIRKASDALSGGAVSEVVVSLARFQLVLRVVDDETFVVLALAPDGNLGKARYLIRRHLLALREEL
ncbi:MAG TPA: roadblock/LC7 domain-containing protein [Myxococcota bacterium]|jgi:predicted regulator of Ras-like GTPase activity (Roadblock/LC7/MglB family)|nr:roadblock/LC7 domain-containing protein [Myxococcota bacterium]